MAVKKTATRSQEFSDSVIDTIREPIIALDHNLRVVNASRSFYKFFKVKPEETVGQLIYDLGNKQWDIPKLRELLETILPEKTTFDDYEVEHDFASIGKRIMLLNARQIQRESGKERIILLAIEDITERKQLEELLEESEERYRRLFETASDGIVLLEKREGRITHANPATEKMLGYNKKEIIGNKLQDIGISLDMDDFQTTMQNLNKTGILNYDDIPVKTRYGEHIDTDIYLTDRARLVQCNIRDITERKEAEERLRQGHRELQALMDVSPIGICWADMKGNIQYNNQKFRDLFGYTVEDIPTIAAWRSQAYPDPAYREQIPSLISLLTEAQKQGKEADPIEVIVTCKDGSIRHVSQAWAFTSNRILVTYADITERRQAEEALRMLVARNEAILSAVPDIIMEVDSCKRYTWANQAGMKFFGDDVVGREASIYFEGDQETYNKVEPLFKGTKDVIYIESWQRRQDGEKRLLAWWCRVLKDQSGQVTGALSSAIDITERKQAEEALKERESKYRLLANNIDDVIFVLDINLNYTYASPSVKILMGYEPEELVNLRFYETMTSSSCDMALRKYSEKMEMEKSGHREIDNPQVVQLEMKRKDGSAVWTEAKTSFIRDENQHPVGVICVSRDITERRQADKELNESERKYRLLADNIDDVLFVLDINLNYTYVSPAVKTLMGYEPEELLNLQASETMTPSSWDMAVRTLSEVMEMEKSGKRESKKPQMFQLEMKRKDGSTVWTEIKVSFIRDENQRPLGMIGVSRDITNRKRADAKLQETLESLRKAVGTTIQVLVSALEARDPYTAGHQLRVADLARAIATEMGLPENIIDGISMAGSIHDIGKLSIPAEILVKPTKLTNLEFLLIKEHSLSGYEMLKNVESPWPLAQIVYQHHERMNGTGYPRNLKGDEILMEARIMAVADVVEAMASHRPYRASLGIEVAIEEIEKNKGILYDDVVADACLRLFREKDYTLIIK